MRKQANKKNATSLTLKIKMKLKNELCYSIANVSIHIDQCSLRIVAILQNTNITMHTNTQRWRRSTATREICMFTRFVYELITVCRPPRAMTLLALMPPQIVVEFPGHLTLHAVLVP